MYTYICICIDTYIHTYTRVNVIYVDVHIPTCI